MEESVLEPRIKDEEVLVETQVTELPDIKKLVEEHVKSTLAQHLDQIKKELRDELQAVPGSLYTRLRKCLPFLSR